MHPCHELMYRHLPVAWENPSTLQQLLRNMPMVEEAFHDPVSRPSQLSPLFHELYAFYTLILHLRAASGHLLQTIRSMESPGLFHFPQPGFFLRHIAEKKHRVLRKHVGMYIMRNQHSVQEQKHGLMRIEQYRR